MKKIINYSLLVLLISTIFMPFIGLNTRVAEGAGDAAFDYFRFSPINFLPNGGLGTLMALAYILPIVSLAILGCFKFKFNKIICISLNVILLIESVFFFYETNTNYVDTVNQILNVVLLLLLVINLICVLFKDKWFVEKSE